MRDLQPQQEGDGQLFERRYWVDIKNSPFTAEDVMNYVMGHINEFALSFLAEFEKSKGSSDEMQQGDEFSVQIAGPWNGEVRVIQVDETSFEFMTLEGHPEAGTIRFRAIDLEQGFRFEVRSLARTSTGMVTFLQETLRVGMKLQETMWLTYCQNIAEWSHGEIVSPPQSLTVNREDSWWA